MRFFANTELLRRLVFEIEPPDACPDFPTLNLTSQLSSSIIDHLAKSQRGKLNNSRETSNFSCFGLKMILLAEAEEHILIKYQIHAIQGFSCQKCDHDVFNARNYTNLDGNSVLQSNRHHIFSHHSEHTIRLKIIQNNNKKFANE